MSALSFPSRKRLDEQGVQAVLRKGRRIARPMFDLRMLSIPASSAEAGARIAISVPKRQLKSAVARNRIKRLVREVFRVHAISHLSADMLVTYKSKRDARDASLRVELRAEFQQLLDHACREVQRNSRRMG